MIALNNSEPESESIVDNKIKTVFGHFFCSVRTQTKKGQKQNRNLMTIASCLLIESIILILF